MSLISKILNREEFRNAPPVLIDIGASGTIHKNWKALAPYSVCIAFDADQRDFTHTEKESKDFKKLHVFNCIVAEKKSEAENFYLTKSPHCSSFLSPDAEGLKDWAFASYFQVQQTVKLKTIDLPTVLNELNLQGVDWFKSDAQGVDLRLFKSLGDKAKTTIAAEFEPGIINAYEGEDKMWDVLAFMNTQGFWLSDLTIKGSQRISEKNLNRIFENEKLRKLLTFTGRISPGWGEMIYLNNFKEKRSVRDHLLGWVIATLLEQHGFAMELAEKGATISNENIFLEMEDFSIKKLKTSLLNTNYFSLAIKKIKRNLNIN